MTELTALEEALLDLGMEDLIALPETLHAPELDKLLSEVDPVPRIAAAQIALLRGDRIQVWSAPWPADPEIVDSPTAVDLLQVASHYEFNSPADLECRVYYVNVDNLRVERNAPPANS